VNTPPPIRLSESASALSAVAVSTLYSIIKPGARPTINPAKGHTQFRRIFVLPTKEVTLNSEVIG
jgi:hypothetical protein